jgi:hypothetical protein
MSKDVNYYLEHQDEFDTLSEAEKTQLTINGYLDSGEGDTKAAEEAAAAAAQEAEAAKAEEQAAAPAAASEEEKASANAAATDDKPVVMTKDGKHTIPFEELQKARDNAASLEKVVADQKALIEQLQAAKEADAGTGKTQNQDELLAGLKEHFPELAEVLAPVIEKIAGSVKEQVSAIEAKLSQDLKPLQETVAKSAEEAHYEAIANAHSDYEDLLSSGKIEAWIATKPSFLRDSYNAVLEKGTAAQAIELFDSYKAENSGGKQETVNTDDPAAKAKAAVAEAKAKPPVSLSDVPAGAKAPHDEAEAMMQMGEVNLLQSMLGKPLDQIRGTLDKVL